MTELEDLNNLITGLQIELDNYAERKTKAISLRIRKFTQRLNKIGPSLRAELVAADKAGS